ncbi:hypothetical protein [Micromonospora parathelypteridis]|uniref:Uncharacterized protein n=1 Tax=Micromonospora parathelypteridis TaxID=1839617 RepID=A0A840VYI1_9ACTN|nr:hypothetical protein [Micromonospora parathelypteridis]MBB5481036.1 hypothetical protein [Micromonospora parathelypteridis]GGO20389.1 hypothetical protein GCM10011576_37630 [Micromonospora parathelypteridis]
MSTPVSTVTTAEPTAEASRWAGTPLATEHWLEGVSGFPAGGVGGRAVPADPATVVATARGFRLTRGHLDEVLAFAEFLAGEALDFDERAEIEQDVADSFEDSPKRALLSLRQLAGGVRRVTSISPVRRAQRRLQVLTTTYLLELRRQTDGHELSTLMATVSRHNPIVRYRAGAGIVLVADAMAARMEQHRLVLSLTGRGIEASPALADQLLDRADKAGRMEFAEFAGSELRLLLLREWLRELGNSELDRTREDLDRAVGSALDVDIVVQQLGYRASLDIAGRTF